MSLSDELLAVMALQGKYSTTPTVAMNQRRELIRSRIPASLEETIANLSDENFVLDVEGKDGAGKKSRIPWVRVFCEEYSPSAQRGWYLAFLFSADGLRTYLCLMTGATSWKEGNWRKQTPIDLHQRVDVARKTVANELVGSIETIDLGDPGELARLYESATVTAVCYQSDNFPQDDQIKTDVVRFVQILKQLWCSLDVEDTPTLEHAYDPAAILESGDHKNLETYCQAHSQDGWPVRYDMSHQSFVLSNRNGNEFAIFAGDVGDTLRALWGAPGVSSFAEYSESQVRTFFRLNPTTPLAASLAGTQTRPFWETLRIAGGFCLGLSKPDPALVFQHLAEEHQTPSFIDEVTLLRSTFTNAGIELDQDFLNQCLASIRAGKHLLLVGPPGTGKTAIAIALAEFARQARFADGHLLVTGTTDWTSQDTLGGYWLQADGSLKFRPGFILDSVSKRKWLVIDEFNRADLDKCLGPFFTVLSGQSAELPYIVDVDGQAKTVEILQQEGVSTPSTFRVNSTWRMIGTMNTWDRDVLFEMSYALKRRLVVLEVPPLAASSVVKVAGRQGLDNLDFVEALADLTFGENSVPLGVGIVLDCARLETENRKLNSGAVRASSQVDALLAMVVPQLQHLAGLDQVKAVDQLCERLGIDESGRARIRAALLVKETWLSSNQEGDEPVQSEDDD